GGLSDLRITAPDHGLERRPVEDLLDARGRETVRGVEITPTEGLELARDRGRGRRHLRGQLRVRHADDQGRGEGESGEAVSSGQARSNSRISDGAVVASAARFAIIPEDSLPVGFSHLRSREPEITRHALAWDSDGPAIAWRSPRARRWPAAAGRTRRSGHRTE